MFSFSLPRRVPPQSVHVVGQQTKNLSFSEIKTIFKFDVRENKDHPCTREHIRVIAVHETSVFFWTTQSFSQSSRGLIVHVTFTVLCVYLHLNKFINLNIFVKHNSDLY